MKTVLRIWLNAQLLNIVLFCPLLVVPVFYFRIVAFLIGCGLPAIPLFYATFVIVHKCTAHRPLPPSATALVCLLPMLIITCLCASLAGYGAIAWVTGQYQYSLWYCLFGLPFCIPVTETVLNRKEDIHRFIYPHLYTDKQLAIPEH